LLLLSKKVEIDEYSTNLHILPSSCITCIKMPLSGSISPACSIPCLPCSKNNSNNNNYLNRSIILASDFIYCNNFIKVLSHFITFNIV
jgi:hypothetical protein